MDCGSVDIYDDSIRRLANSSGLMVAAMDYRLAPEHPFPSGLNVLFRQLNGLQTMVQD